MVKTERQSRRLAERGVRRLSGAVAAGRSQFYREIAAGPFYGYNRPGAKPSEAVIENWWRQGMMGGAEAHYDGIVAFSQTDFTEDLRKITVPVLVTLHRVTRRAGPHPHQLVTQEGPVAVLIRSPRRRGRGARARS